MYQTIVFDCDGVILDSNRIKTEAFRNSTLAYGEDASQAMVEYHTQNGGVSRYLKFSHFLSSLVPKDMRGPDLDELLSRYVKEVQLGLATCAISSGLQVLREETSSARWLVVSGGDQEELRALFKARGIFNLFDGGIFGSPDDKDSILKRELATQNIKAPALFIGDSRYDHQVAVGNGLDFIFLNAWTEFKGWSDYCAKHGITTHADVAGILLNQACRADI